jgi:adenylate cyclase
MNAEVFSLPGFQPLTAPNQVDQVAALPDGSIDIIFYENRPLDEHTPVFNIYIGKEFGNQVQVYRSFDNNFVTSIRHVKSATKSYRLRVEAHNVQILPGTYVLRFFADSREVAIKSLMVSNSLIQSPHLPPCFRP